MGIIKNPALFTSAYNIELDGFDTFGALNPVLNVDTRLFIDPTLISASGAPEISEEGYVTITTHFNDLLTLLRASQNENDLPWREALRRMMYSEIGATCLGYGSASIRGSGFGPQLSTRLTRIAKEVIDLGLNDPELFLLLPLLEEGVGPDRISDMVTNIISHNLAEYTGRICGQLNIPMTKYMLNGQEEMLPENPFIAGLPVLLCPRDILVKLPTASDWSEVMEAASRNAELRRRVNLHIGRLWKGRTSEERERNRAAATSSSEAIGTLLEVFKSIVARPYNTEDDPDGLLIFQKQLGTITSDYPLELTNTSSTSLQEVWIVIEEIVEQFRHLVEDRNFAKLLWRDKRTAHNERVAQLLFFIVADSYCKANNVDITPEADTGAGPVDFKFSKSYDSRALVEVKLSKNPKLVAGYERQLDAYNTAEGSLKSLYLVIDVGHMGRKMNNLLDKKNEMAASVGNVPEVLLIDGKVHPSASLR